MFGNKPRLYVALYVRGAPPTMPGGEDKYHWSFLIFPKDESNGASGQLIHAKQEAAVINGQIGSTWVLENRETQTVRTARMLVRVMIGKVKDQPALENILEGVAVRGNLQGWNCVEWIKEALEAIKRHPDVMGRCVLDWDKVRDAAIQYVEQKAAEHRFDGRAAPGTFVDGLAPTYDLLAEMETQR